MASPFERFEGRSWPRLGWRQRSTPSCFGRENQRQKVALALETGKQRDAANGLGSKPLDVTSVERVPRLRQAQRHAILAAPHSGHSPFRAGHPNAYRVAPLRGFALTFVAACGSISDPTDPLFKRNPPPPPPPTHPIILFVHGWNANASTWNTMIGRFKTDGWQNSELSAFSYDFSKSNATTAGIIKGKVDSIIKARGVTQVTIVTHSMGTLSARYYVRNLDGNGKVSALISLGGANHGTQTAQLCFQ